MFYLASLLPVSMWCDGFRSGKLKQSKAIEVSVNKFEKTSNVISPVKNMAFTVRGDVIRIKVKFINLRLDPPKKQA